MSQPAGEGAGVAVATVRTMADPTPSRRPDDDPTESLDYGPSGYLPARASARARKIVLRSPLGIQWVIASVVAGVVVVVAGVWFLSRTSQPPGPPFEAAVAVADLQGLTELREGVVAVAAGGPVRVYLVPESAVLCPVNGRIEATNGSWSASSGRGFGVESLRRHPSQVHDEVLWVDFTATVDGPAASSRTVAREC